MVKLFINLLRSETFNYCLEYLAFTHHFSQVLFHAHLWMCLMVKVKSNAIKNNTA